MAKKESTFLNMTLTLFIISAVAALLLGFVYNLTKDPIQEAKDNKLKTAINMVVPGAETADNISDDTVMVDDETLVMHCVKADGKVIGTAVETLSKNGFGGTVKIMVGFKNDGEIIDSYVLEHKETPGLGSKMTTNWKDQFKGENPETYKLHVKKDGGDVDAITAATISSRAYSEALDKAYRTFMEYKNDTNRRTDYE